MTILNQQLQEEISHTQEEFSFMQCSAYMIFFLHKNDPFLQHGGKEKGA